MLIKRIAIFANNTTEKEAFHVAYVCHSARLAQRNLPAGQKLMTKGLSNKKSDAMEGLDVPKIFKISIDGPVCLRNTKRRPF